VSHFKQRRENTCLNCNAITAGHYCQVCGQENIEPKESFWHIISHFFNDITHFDGKFFTTTKQLLLKPGFLPGEYLRGKRASYLHPIRMYVFTSAIFFLIFFSLTDGDKIQINGVGPNEEKMIANEKKIESIDSLMADTRDTAILRLLAYQKMRYQSENLAIDSIENDLATTKIKGKVPMPDSTKPVVAIDLKDSLLQNLKDSVQSGNGNFLSFSFSKPDSIKTVEQYKKYQAGLPPEKRDGWLDRIFLQKEILLNSKYRNNPAEISGIILEKFVHSLPQMLFVSLPLFAMVLQLLYIRRKQFFYTDHGLFSIYHFIAVYIIMLFLLLLDKLRELSGWAVFKYLSVACLLFIFFYLYKSMRNFYRQGRAKTILKFVLLCLIAGTITSFLTLGFLLLTFFKV